MLPTENIAHNWLNAFNTRDLDNLLELYDDEAEHFSPKLKLRQPETKGLIKGKPALRAWWADAFERLSELHYAVVSLTADDEKVFMEYTRQVPGEEDMAVAEILRIRNGKIVASRVYHG